jgi:lysozyme
MEVGRVIGEIVFTPLNQNQIDALSVFVFNIGVEDFRHSVVLLRLNEGDLLRAACAMEMWRKADFDGERIVVDALVRRRAAEKALFLTPILGFVPSPTPIVRPRVDQDLTGAVPAQTPVEVKASLEGAVATAERVEPLRSPWPAAPTPEAEEEEVSASQAVAAALTARLQSILREPEDQALAETPETPAAPAPAAETGLAMPLPPAGATIWTDEEAPPSEPLILTPPPPETAEPEPEPAPAHDVEAAPTEAAPELFTAAPMNFQDFEREAAKGPAGPDFETTAILEDVQPSRSIGVVPWLLGLAVLGLIVFSGALFWAFNAKQAGGGLFSVPVLIAGGLGVVGIGCVGLAIYFLLERLGGREEP